jgi:hypothetical protein
MFDDRRTRRLRRRQVAHSSFWPDESSARVPRDSGAQGAQSTPRLSSYIHFEIGGHDLLLERIRDASPMNPRAYRVTVDDMVQPDLEVAQEDRDDGALLRRAFDDWRSRQPAD